MEHPLQAVLELRELVGVDVPRDEIYPSHWSGRTAV